ncbi:PspC domain-containing protein [Puteibacter caeruleilacunae]|nr:PspC domain-containing protein [Puteibacter caeruleilacunae]
MKKTFTINISGAVFHIEEDAYEKLREYLNAINGHFGTSEEGKEIVSDIEMRIAELFREEMKHGDEVVTIEWVEKVVERMGTPEDFMEEDLDDEEPVSQPRRTTARRLYRDPDSRVLGGVLSGMGAYFGIDPVVLRVIFVILFFLSGSFTFGITGGAILLVYILLWIVVPKATTIAQKLEMRGQDANISNIERKIKDEYSAVKDKVQDFTNSKQYATGKEKVSQAGDAAYSGLKLLLKVIVVILGSLLMVAGIVGLIGMILSVVVTKSVIGIIPDVGLHIPAIGDYLFSSGSMWLMIIGAFLVAGLPILMMIFVGSKMVFKYKTNNALIGFSALGAWIVGLFVLFAAGIGQVKNFSNYSNQTNSHVLETTTDTLYLKQQPNNYKIYNDEIMDLGRMKLIMIDGEEILLGETRLDIAPSPSDQFILQMKYNSRGKNAEDARENLQLIEYNFNVKDSVLWLDEFFKLEEEKKWRSQQLDLTLKIPEGKVIYLDESVRSIIYDLDNVGNIHDSKMIGSYWIMKPEGLTQL